MIPEPTPDDMARDAERDYECEHVARQAWIRRAVFAENRVSSSLNRAERAIQLAVAYKTERDQLLAANAKLAQHLADAVKNIESLNQMIRDTGQGQGVIDAYASQCEQLDDLTQRLAASERGDGVELVEANEQVRIELGGNPCQPT